MMARGGIVVWFHGSAVSGNIDHCESASASVVKRVVNECSGTSDSKEFHTVSPGCSEDRRNGTN